MAGTTRVASNRSPGLTIATIALATISSVFPGLASGSLAVQASEDFGITEGAWGWTLSAFFLGSASTSVLLGRAAQRIGPRRQLLATTLASATIQLAIATLAPNFGTVVALLVVAGAVNAAAQTAVNLALSQAGLPRLGLAIATKQSAMPASAMLGGLAVPALALTLGWRWAYGLGAAVAIVAFVGVWRVVAPGVPSQRAVAEAGESTSLALVAAAVMSFLMAFSSGAINAWTVSSGVDAGLDEGVAGLMLSLAAGFGIAMRLVAGSRLDHSRTPPLLVAARVFVVGIAGFALLSIRQPVVHVLAGMMAFGGGWIWPAFTNYAIVDANPASAAKATGMTQTGVYLGVMAGPAVTGPIIDGSGYSAMWLVVAGVGCVSAASLVALSPHLHSP